MSLNIEGTNLHAENINHPNDIYIYYDGGFFVWGWSGPDLSVWFNCNMFVLSHKNYTSTSSLVAAFNEWAGNLKAERKKKETTEIMVSFSRPQDNGSKQLPFCMIIREYYEDDKIVHAEVLKEFNQVWDCQDFRFSELQQQ